MTSGEKLEVFFRDYLNNEIRYADSSVSPLKSLIGTLKADGNLSGGLSWGEAEARHNWIQWAFPIKTISKYNTSALCSDDYLQQVMQQDPALRNVLLLSFRYYLNFMGIDLIPGLTIDSQLQDIIFIARPDFAVRIKNYLDHPHNFMRTTRILGSLKIHGLEQYCSAFFEFLTSSEDFALSAWCKQRGLVPRIDQSTQNFWRTAATVN
jgi:hypothetical protein